MTIFAVFGNATTPALAGTAAVRRAASASGWKAAPREPEETAKKACANPRGTAPH